MSEEVTKEQAAANTGSITDATTSAKNQEEKAATGADTKPAPLRATVASKPRSTGGARRSFGGKKPFRKGSRFRSERPKPEFEQKIINISRVTRVVKGGRRLSFRVDMAIGDKKGRVGLGSGKATDTSLAIQKSFNQARKNLIKVKLTKTNSIPYTTTAKITSSRVEMMPNKERGLVAGSTLRTILELAGITDVSARVHSRSKNKLNNAKAAVKALETFSVPMEPLKEIPKDDGRKRFNNRGRRGGGQGRAPSNR